MGEVYLTDAFRNLQAAPPKISVGVSVHGSVLDLEVDTGAFPVAELRELLHSLHQKKRYHRLRDGSLLRLDDSLEGLDELNDTLELSGAKLKSGHAELPLYRAPSLDWALSGQNGLRFNRDDAFRRISRSFHAVKDSEYTPPESLHNVLRKYQRDGYRWLRTLDGYGMGGILADDMGLGKTVQVLSYLLAMKESGQRLPSLIVCPASLVLNWQEECQKFTPQLSCVAMDGDAAHRAELAKQWAEADLVVTSYDLMRRDEELYSGQQLLRLHSGRSAGHQEPHYPKVQGGVRGEQPGALCPYRHPGGEPLGRAVEHLLLPDAGVSAALQDLLRPV